MSKVICGYVNIFDKNITLFTMDESDPKDTETMGIIDLNDLPTSIYAISQIKSIFLEMKHTYQV